MILKACTDSKYLSSILFAKRFMEIAGMIVPLILIISVAVSLSKIVMSPEMKNNQKHLKSIYSKTIAAVAIFFVPTLVNALLITTGAPGLTSSTCWKNANETTIKTYQEAEKQQEEAEKAKNKAEKEKADQIRKVVKATREAARVKNEKESEEAKKKALEASEEASWNSSGTASATAAELIRVAESKVGVGPDPNEVTRGYGAIGGSYSYHWCAAFVWYCSSLSGVYPNKVTIKTAGVQSFMSYFQNKGQYKRSAAHGGNYIPKMGDYIFFDWQGNPNDGDHIGIVKSATSSQVIYIDGNNGDRVVDNNRRSLNDSNIIGYGVWE